MEKLKIVLSAAALIGGVGLGIASNSAKNAVQVNNAYLPGKCETPVQYCEGGTQACTYTLTGDPLLFQVAGECIQPATRQ